MLDFYIEELFEFKGELFGRLRIHSDENFIRYVRVKKVTKEFTDWVSLEEELEEKAKKYFERNFKK